MSEPQLKETIAQRIERGKAQNSTEGGAIVPFPQDTDFNNPLILLPTHQRSWLADAENRGFALTAYVYRSERGEPAFAILRIDHPEYGPEHPELKKDIRPLRCDRVIGSRAAASPR